jgi:RNA-directed DNA polymerase
MKAVLEIDPLLEPPAVRDAWQRVRRNGGAPGSDRITISELEPVFEQVWPSVARSVKCGEYRPIPLRMVPIPKPSGGTRELAIPSVMDRVVQQALARGISDAWEPRFSGRSFAYRPGRGPADAIDHLLREAAGMPEPWAASLDIEDFFESIPFDRTCQALRATPCSLGMEEIAMRCVRCRRRNDAGEFAPLAGLPQGSPLSPVLANAVLDPLDRMMEQAGFLYLRYADNLLILAPGEARARDARQHATDTLAGLGLKLNQEKSTVARLSEIVFLGFAFRPATGGGHELEVSQDALDSCLSHLHLLRSAGADHGDLQRFLAQWLGYFGKAGSSDSLCLFLREISREFALYPDYAARSRGKPQTGYDGSPRPSGVPLPDAGASGPDLWLPFARMLMQRVRIGADFSQGSLIPQLRRIRIGIGRHHFTFRL